MPQFWQGTRPIFPRTTSHDDPAGSQPRGFDDRGQASLAVQDVERMVVWGNHSPTMFADWRFATAGGKSIAKLISDEAWYRETLIPTVAQRGTTVLNARGASSAASAANAAIDHMRDWLHGSNGRWVSMGIASNGSYG